MNHKIRWFVLLLSAALSLKVDLASSESPSSQKRTEPTPLSLLPVNHLAPAGPLEDGNAAYKRGDFATALHLFRPLAAQGNPLAQHNIGIMYEQGQGVSQDYAEAVKWYRKAANQGFAQAQHNLGVMHEFGRGVHQDYAEAAKWYRMAANQGLAISQYNFGNMSAKGQGVQQDYSEAARWFRKAADQGFAVAQYSLGVLYANGQNAQPDYAEAAKWFRKASDQGYAAAMSNLGAMYHNGQGVRQDHAEAIRWYRMAAEQGFAMAQYNLGIIYANGQGVHEDYAEAVKWFRFAAAQGSVGAQNSLANLYARFPAVGRQSVVVTTPPTPPALTEPQPPIGITPTKQVDINSDNWFKMFKNCVNSYVAHNITQNDGTIIDGAVRRCATIVFTHWKNMPKAFQDSPIPEQDTWVSYLGPLAKKYSLGLGASMAPMHHLSQAPLISTRIKKNWHKNLCIW
jgi:TPR repeat protein